MLPGHNAQLSRREIYIPFPTPTYLDFFFATFLLFVALAQRISTQAVSSMHTLPGNTASSDREQGVHGQLLLGGPAPALSEKQRVLQQDLPK